MSKCILANCTKETDRDFCSKEHKWEHAKQIDKMIPPIANRDVLSEKENGMIASFLEKRSNVH